MVLSIEESIYKFYFRSICVQTKHEQQQECHNHFDDSFGWDSKRLPGIWLFQAGHYKIIIIRRTCNFWYTHFMRKRHPERKRESSASNSSENYVAKTLIDA